MEATTDIWLEYGPAVSRLLAWFPVVSLALACNAGPTPPTPTDVAAPPPEAKTTKSGLAYRVLTPGTGTEHPTARSQVEVHYSGWTTDGELFDSSVQRGEPSKFGLLQVIPGGRIARDR